MTIVYIPAIVIGGVIGSFRISHDAVNKASPNSSVLYMRPHVYFSFLTPRVPKQDSASRRRQKPLVTHGEAKSIVDLSNCFSSLSTNPTVQPISAQAE